MVDAWFAKPVLVHVGFGGDIEMVETAPEALALLKRSWRTFGSDKHSAAISACRDAVSGFGTAAVARSAFLAAADEARVLAEGGMKA